MGEVYLARDTILERNVAIKQLADEVSQNSDRLQRFIQEARAASALNHPNILTIHEVGETDGKHYIATEYIEGETLRRLMQHQGLSTREALGAIVQVASALAAAHQAGIIYRDIKLENVMLRPVASQKFWTSVLRNSPKSRLSPPIPVHRPWRRKAPTPARSWERCSTCRPSRLAGRSLMRGRMFSASVWCSTKWSPGECRLEVNPALMCWRRYSKESRRPSHVLLRRRNWR